MLKKVLFLDSEDWGASLCWMGDPCDPSRRPETLLTKLSVFRLPPSRTDLEAGITNKQLVTVVTRVCDQVGGCRIENLLPVNCSRILSSVKLRVGYNGTQVLRSSNIFI